MKNKAIFVLFLALFAVVLSASTVLASVTDGFVTIDEVQVNDISVDGRTVIGHVSDTVPVKIFFTANDDVNEEVRVKVYIEGYRGETSETITLSTPLEDGISDVARFSIDLPSSVDLDDLSEDLTLVVRFSARGETSVEKEYTLRMTRDLHSLNVLSVDAPERTVAGSTIAVDVVVKNDGSEELEDVYLRISVEDLGVQRNVYLGDLDERDERDFDDDRSIDRHDTVSKRVYLALPTNAVPGVYNLEVEAYNYDVRATASERIVVDSVETGVLPTATGRTIAPGEETTFDVVLVNPNNRLVVYSILPEEVSGLIVEVTEPIVTVSAESGRTVKVNVRATESAEEGTYLVKVNVNDENGLVEQVSFSVNVEEDSARIGPAFAGTGNAVFILTVILVIIFVVLLIVLIVLLTRRPAETTEEFGETSYY